METPDIMEHIVNLGGFKTAATTFYLNKQWHDISLPILQTTNPLIKLLKDNEKVLQGTLCNALLLPAAIVRLQPYTISRGDCHVFDTKEAVYNLLLTNGGLICFVKRIIAHEMRELKRDLLTPEEVYRRSQVHHNRLKRKEEALIARKTDFAKYTDKSWRQVVRELCGYVGYSHESDEDYENYFSMKLLKPRVQRETILSHLNLLLHLEGVFMRILSKIPEEITYTRLLIKDEIEKAIQSNNYSNNYDINEEDVKNAVLTRIGIILVQDEQRNEQRKRKCACYKSFFAIECEYKMCGICCKGCKRHPKNKDKQLYFSCGTWKQNS